MFCQDQRQMFQLRLSNNSSHLGSLPLNELTIFGYLLNERLALHIQTVLLFYNKDMEKEKRK